MQPNGTVPAPQPTPNPYDYILNPQQPGKKPSLLGGAKPNKLVMVAFVVFVILIVVIAVTVFRSLTKKSYDAVISLTARQTEIVRVTELGLTKANDPATLIYLSTVHSVTLSEKNDTIAFLKKKGQKVTALQLAAKKDTSTDKALTQAAQNNSYDQVVLEKVNGLVDAYHKAEKNVTGTTDSNSEKTLFSTLLTNAKVLSTAATAQN